LHGGRSIDSGCTADLVSLHRRPDGIFILSLMGTSVNPENRWTLDFSRALHRAFDALEEELSGDPAGSPAALLTVSNNPKFFSNGIDPEWVMSKTTPREDLLEWDDLTMPAFARVVLLPIPTLCAINGHAFGAGLMFALAHDYRLQQQERGFLCAPEVAIGFNTPLPEFTLFRYCMPSNAFYETVLHSKRWTADDAFRCGIVQALAPAADLLETAIKTAAQHRKLSTNRKCFQYTKYQTKGEVARQILCHCFPGGKQRSAATISPGLKKHVQHTVVEGRLDAMWSTGQLSRL